VIADIVTVLRRETYHGLSVVAACVVGSREAGVIADIPAIGGLDGVAEVVRRFDADTVNGL